MNLQRIQLNAAGLHQTLSLFHDARLSLQYLLSSTAFTQEAVTVSKAIRLTPPD